MTISKVICFIKELVSKKINSKNEKTEPFESLSPSVNDCNIYFKALKWAVENATKEDIKNIALTGPYGSGKSSILKKFEQDIDKKKFRCLNISLATF